MRRIDYFYYFYYETTKESGSRRVDETESHDRYIVRSGRKIHLTLFVTARTQFLKPRHYRCDIHVHWFLYNFVRGKEMYKRNIAINLYTRVMHNFLFFTWNRVIFFTSWEFGNIFDAVYIDKCARYFWASKASLTETRRISKPICVWLRWSAIVLLPLRRNHRLFESRLNK